MSRRRSREFDVFSMSFLDTICCAFGAIILLFVLSKFGEPRVNEQSRIEKEGQVAKLQQELFEIRGQTETLQRLLKERRIEESAVQTQLARLRGDLSSVKGELAGSKSDAEVTNTIEGQLVNAQESLTAEMKRLLGSNYRRSAQDAVGGISVDSEYVVFIIDTSGSMYNFSWQNMLRRVGEVLNIYPKLKGFQVMNDQGVYMFNSYKGRWLPDTPAQRKMAVDRLRTWTPFSASSPAEGIIEAIRSYESHYDKISLYVFGDEFTGPSIEQVVALVDRLNPPGPDGQRPVRINALGFPLSDEFPPLTGIRYAALMRILCRRNGGAFVGLNPS